MAQSEGNAFAVLAGFARPCARTLAASVALAIAGSACGMVPYVAVAQVVVMICGADYRMEPIAGFALLGLVGYLGSVWLSAALTMLSHRCAFRILASMRTALARKLSRIPMGTVLDTPSGKHKTLLVDTVEKLELPLAHMVPELTANILVPVFMLGYLFVLDWRLALISLATIPIGLACYRGMMHDYERRYGRVLSAGKAMDAAIVEYIGGIEVIKTFNQTTASYGKYVDAVQECNRAKATWFRQTNGFYAAGLAIMPSCLVGLLPLGSWLFANGSLDAPTFIACIILALGLVGPLIQALRYTDSLAMVDATAKEVANVLSLEEMRRPELPVKLDGYQVAFRNVRFGYGDAEVLRGVTFETVPGGMTAIVGPSGSGKTTVARLIASFYEAGSGEVSIGGVDVRRIPLNQAMQAVAYVSQDNFLFNQPIRDNIRTGNRDATDEQVEEAARKASCHDFVTRLPQGYDTLAGDAGARLSGGERQRIAIARAMLKDSPVILLDEATAYADPENEACIQASLDELVRGKTLIVIAHRLSTIIRADRIVVLDGGRVVAQGAHEELLDGCDLYRALWRAHEGARDDAGEERS